MKQVGARWGSATGSDGSLAACPDVGGRSGRGWLQQKPAYRAPLVIFHWPAMVAVLDFALHDCGGVNLSWPISKSFEALVAEWPIIASLRCQCQLCLAAGHPFRGIRAYRVTSQLKTSQPIGHPAGDPQLRSKISCPQSAAWENHWFMTMYDEYIVPATYHNFATTMAILHSTY